MRLLLALLAVSLVFAAPCFAANSVFTTKVGDFEVSMLSERQGEGDPKILIGASAEDIKAFLLNGTFTNAVCVFLIKTPEKTFLVDTGFGTHLSENMAALGLKPEDVDCLLLTHSHGDHIGGMVRDGQAAFPNAQVYADAKEIAWSEKLRETLVFYADKNYAFTPASLEQGGTQLFPGIRAIAAYGHTPGHTMFLVESKGEKLLIWGDLTHAMAIQVPRPGVSVTYDADPVMAALSRKEVLKFAAQRKILVAGMHIAYPGIGRIEVEDTAKEIYQYTPVK